VNGLRVVSGTLFYPRGGSAFAARALARGLRDEGIDVTLVAGSRPDLGAMADARSFYAGLDVRAVQYGDGTPLELSFEDRPGGPDRVFAALDDIRYQRQVDAWARELDAAGAAQGDALHLHHLTPLNAAAAVVASGTPVVGQLHGTELLMLEAIEAGARWRHGAAWAQRLRAWAARCERLIAAPGNVRRAAGLLGVERDRFVTLPNGLDPELFRRRRVDRHAVWRRVLVDEPRGWLPGLPPGSVRYGDGVLDALERDPVIVFIGRFTGVKALPLLLEAFAAARPGFRFPASLVIVGGHPGEWEGEHPAETIGRLGLDDVLLAGWQEHDRLPEQLSAADLLVLPSERESFGQVIVEAMACGVPAVAAASFGPAYIIDDGVDGWLFRVGDRAALTATLLDAVNRPEERARRGRHAELAARGRFAWPAITKRLAEILRDVAAPQAPIRATRRA
jgi:glycosyltransferase involved in cell wall biosynthesis